MASNLELGGRTSFDHNLKIRNASLADIPAIQKIAFAAWPAAYGDMISSEYIAHELKREYSEAALKIQMSEESHRCLLAEHPDNTAVGFASFGALLADSATKTGRLAKLHKLYLWPDFKGCGYGSALLSAVIAECRQAGYEQLQLSVNRLNPAIAFYQRHGFSILQKMDVAVGSGFVRNNYVMGKSLL